MPTSPAEQHSVPEQPGPGQHSVPGQPGPGYFDVAVLGAGPAGLAAAGSAAAGGAQVVVIDANPRPGGQYWRHRDGDEGTSHAGWPDFQRLRAAAAQHDRVTFHYGAAVWHIEPVAGGGFSVHATTASGDLLLSARTLVLAPGAYDRQLPFPGWTLPGVFTAGGVQALLKGQGVVAGSRIVVAGTGPFLVAVAAGLARAGASVAGVFEAGSVPLSFARHPLTLARNAGKLREAVHYASVLARYRIPYRTGTAVVAAHGVDEVTGVDVARVDRNWNVLPGSGRRVDCDTVAVGYGFTPQLELAGQLGCATRRDVDGSLVAIVDADQRSSVPGVYLAGEATGVGGAQLAVAEGRIAGRAAARQSGGPVSRAAADRRLQRGRAAHRQFATALHQAYPVRPGWMTWPQATTIVCRCEEVSLGAIDEAITDLGATDPRAVKLYARPGMGLCQGKVCGYATACLVAQRGGREVTVADLQGIAGRPIAQPVTLGELAAAHRSATGPDSAAPLPTGSAAASPRPSDAAAVDPAVQTTKGVIDA